MRFNTLFFLMIISCLSLALAQASFDDCCLKYVKKMSSRTQRHVVDYRRQVTDGGCNIPAIIFTMRRGRVLCTDPREAWVVELMEKIEEKKARNKMKNTSWKSHHRQAQRG
uniref:C-C motif chemokine 4 n=1 Tax=Scatophagus argus TaxID=75038 RepID=UPI001ED85186|nr:C-C motif chemokine 4 [Scatophagus argus]